MRSLVLLRGVNVGGHHKVSMTDLSTWLEAAGFTGVVTYIQSGNIVLTHTDELDVAPRVRDVIAEHTGWSIAVIVRSASQMTDVISRCPYPDAQPTQLHVSFLDAAADDALIAAARSVNWSPEQHVVNGREVYLYVPDGMGRSVMVPKLKLLKGATTRNWNTVLALNELVNNSSN